MPDLQVDLDGLTSFARRLERICEALDDAEALLRGDDDALGDGTVVSALHRFEDRWRDGRDKIEKNAKTLGTMVTGSVEAYRRADEDLARSLSTEQT